MGCRACTIRISFKQTHLYVSEQNQTCLFISLLILRPQSDYNLSERVNTTVLVRLFIAISHKLRTIINNDINGPNFY